MGWDKTHGRLRLTVCGLPAQVKSQLLKEKARGGGSITSQVCNALARCWQADGIMECPPVSLPPRYYTPPSIYPPRPAVQEQSPPQVFYGVSAVRPDAYVSQAPASAGSAPPGTPVRVGCPRPPEVPQTAAFEPVAGGRFAGMVRQRVEHREDPSPPWQ
jgi:hypothetical protein